MVEIHTEYLIQLQKECQDMEAMLKNLYEEVQRLKKPETGKLLEQIENRLHTMHASEKFIGEALLQYVKTDHDIADVLDHEIVLYPGTVFATSRFDELDKQVNLMPFHRE